jgi:integrase
MAGQIIKRDERTWLVRIFQGRDANGKRIYFNKTIHGTKKDAQRYLNAALRDKDVGIFVEPASLPLDSYLDKWLESVARPRVRERTFEGYEWMLAHYIRPRLGAKRLCDVQPLDVQNLYNELRERGISAKTIRNVHQVLSSALTQAVRWKMLVQNPCALCELPRREKKEMQSLSAEQVIGFLDVSRDDKWFVAFLIAVETGARPEEYLGLRWSDVDFENRVVCVRRALVWRKGGGFIFTEPKTSRSRRSIPLSTSAIDELKKHRRRQGERRLKLGEQYENHDLVFATETGTPLLWRNLTRRHFKPLLRKAGLPEIRLYDLRHTTATLLLQAGENPKIVSERLGHASIALTLDTYSHVLPTMQRGATEKLERMIYRA